jgi:hypothetical protein
MPGGAVVLDPEPPSPPTVDIEPVVRQDLADTAQP